MANKRKLRYMLDTNIVIKILNNSSEKAYRELTSHSKSEICISSIVKSELYYGAYNSDRSRLEHNLKKLERFCENITTVNFDNAAAEEYGKIKTELRRRGELIGGNDILIAAHASSLDLTLVTNNTREFVRVPSLEVADWS